VKGGEIIGQSESLNRRLPEQQITETGCGALGSRSLDILIYPAGRPGAIVAEKELRDRARSRAAIAGTGPRVHMVVLRNALGERQFGSRDISDIEGRAYSFVGSVVCIE
jgi:DNA-binding winged helix-turn-helix (wHTH) protein